MKNSSKTHDVVYVGIFAAVIAVLSWISIPAAVPFTLQTMGVFTAVGILGGKRGTLAVLTYILLGAVGVPVFAGFSGGISVILGTTGGYIVGFLFSALIMWGMEKLFGNGKVVLAISMVLGLIACYAVGTVWFMAVYAKNSGAVGVGTVLGWCVIPFIIPDLIKIAVSLILTGRLKKGDKVMKNIIKLRAHHVLCLAFFEGKGYSDNFVNHMQSVLDELENNPVIQITAGCDLICNECPNLKGGVCATPDLVREYDNRVLSLCGLAENDIISWNDFSSLAAEKIIRDGKREGVCGNCEWNEICKSKE